MDVDFSKLDVFKTEKTDAFQEQPIPPKEHLEGDKNSVAPFSEYLVSNETNRGWMRYKNIPIVFFLALATFFFVNYFFSFHIIQGVSMLPTLGTGDLVLIDNVSLKWDQVYRGDIIAFIDVRSEKQPKLVKRVIGLPYETVTVSTTTGSIFVQSIDKNVYILHDGGKLELDNKVIPGPGTVLGPLDYFLVGDNKGYSQDSRKFGTVQPSEMIGRVLLKLW
jgi:signal peptidase I